MEDLIKRMRHVNEMSRPNLRYEEMALLIDELESNITKNKVEDITPSIFAEDDPNLSEMVPSIPLEEIGEINSTNTVEKSSNRGRKPKS